MPAEEQPPCIMGARVRIGGLKAKPELNGEAAVIESLNEQTGRVNVRVSSTGEVLALKPEALTPEPEKAATCEPMHSSVDADERAVSVRANASAWYPDARHAITLKLTLTSKQLKKPLSAAVVAPFLKALTKRLSAEREDAKEFALEDVARATVDGAELADLSLAAGIVLLPRKVVTLELHLHPPPPPPPLLHKNVALTRLETTAYRAEYNGMWGEAIAYDDSRAWYHVAVGGDRSKAVWVPPEKLIDLSVRRSYTWSPDEFDDFVAPHRKTPPAGTVAYDIHLRNLDRHAEEDRKKRHEALARKAFAAVPFDEKAAHVRVQLDVALGQLHLHRAALRGELKLRDGNQRLRSAVDGSSSAKAAMEALAPRLEAAAQEAAELAETTAATAEAAPAAAATAPAAAPVAAAAPAADDAPVAVGDGPDAAAHAPVATAAARPTERVEAMDATPVGTPTERVEALRADIAAAIELANETCESTRALSYHSANSKKCDDFSEDLTDSMATANWNAMRNRLI